MGAYWAIRCARAAAPSTYPSSILGPDSLALAPRRVHVRPGSMLTALCLAMVFLGASPPAWVHHSGAMFDRTRVIEIKGVVKEFAWTNPHSSFKVEVEDQLWSIE